MAKSKNSTKSRLNHKRPARPAPPTRNGIHKPSPSSSSSPSSSRKPKPQPHKQQHSQQPIIPFTPSDRILLIGEGDFSFSLSLLLHHAHTAANLTCTTNDSAQTCLQKYPQARAHTAALLAVGHDVRYGVEVVRPGRITGLPKACFPGALPASVSSTATAAAITTASSDSAGVPKSASNPDSTSLHSSNNNGTSGSRNSGGGSTKKGWDVALFNFPHVGGKSTDVNRQVRANQELLLYFFKGTVPLLARGGRGSGGAMEREGRRRPRVVVTLFEGEPYTLWNIRDLARHAGVGLVLVRSMRFEARAGYPAYRHARTLGNVVSAAAAAAAPGGGTKGDGKGKGTKGRKDGVVKDKDGDEGLGDEEGAVREEEGKRAGKWRGEEREARMYIFEVEGGDDDDDGGPGTWNGDGNGGANGVALGKKRKRKGQGKGKQSDDDDDSD